MNTCVDKNKLEQYLSGWVDSETSDAIEAHLTDCDRCEQTVAELESETATQLPDVARIARLATSQSDSPELESSKSPDSADPMLQVLQQVRNWNPALAASANGDQETSADLRDRSGQTLPFPAADFAQYEIQELIGRGGMAEVYRARHRKLDRNVAIKLFPVPRAKVRESINRIDREIRAVGRLKHPAIVSAVDAGEYNGIPYLATEFIDGLDVGKLVRRSASLGIADACEIIRQAALGLDYAHANGIIHRDIKPSNIMLDENGVVKILDFGLVRLDECSSLPAELTSVGQLLGTLDYMAPEQADRADSVDHRSDIYSLGATFFRLLAGRAPYAATANQSPLEKLRLLAVDQPPRIQTLRPEISDDLAAIVDQTLARDPAQRPSSAAHLAQLLQPFCEGADPVALIKQAQQSPAADFEQEFGYSDEASLLASSQIPVKPNTEGGSNRWRTIRRWIIAAGFAAAAVWLGIVLVLETQKGRIIIETDSPNLNVSLIDTDAERSQQLKLIPGENSTRIFAGRYEIRIDDGTDNYTLEKNAFVLKRGETVVAKVRLDEPAGTAEIAWSENSHAWSRPQATSGLAEEAKPESPTLGTLGTLNKKRYWTTEELQRKSMQVYPVVGDPDFLVNVLETVLKGATGVQMQADPKGERIFIYATGEQHLEVIRVFETLQLADSTRPQTGEPEQTGSIGSSPTLPLNEPVFAGHPLNYWLNKFEFDLDRETRLEAIKAIRELTQADSHSRDKVRALLASRLLPLPSLKWFSDLTWSVGLSQDHIDALLAKLESSTDEETIQIINLLLRDTFYRSGEEFEKVDPFISQALKVLANREQVPDRKLIDRLVNEMHSGFRGAWIPWFETRVKVRALSTDYEETLRTMAEIEWLGPRQVVNVRNYFRDKTAPIFVENSLRQLESEYDELTDSEFIELISLLCQYSDPFFEDQRQRDAANNSVSTEHELNLSIVSTLDKLLTKIASSQNNTYSLVRGYEIDIVPPIRQNNSLIHNFLVPSINSSAMRLQDWRLGRLDFNFRDSGNRALAVIALLHRMLPILKDQQAIETDGLQSIVDATASARKKLTQAVQQRIENEDGNVKLDSNFISLRYGDRNEDRDIIATISVLEEMDDSQQQAGRGRRPNIETRSLDFDFPAEELGAALVHDAALKVLEVLELYQSTSPNKDGDTD